MGQIKNIKLHIVTDIKILPQMKSTIQRVPDAEDGEIISSPELDAADIAIKIHEEVSSSEDSDVEETTPAKIETPAKPSGSGSSKHEVIIVDTPEEKEKNIKSAVSNDFREKAVPAVSRRHIHSLAQQDDDIEIDHLEITAPRQSEATKKNSKPKSLKDSPNKGKHLTMLKDRRTHKGISPKDEFGRKRPYDVNDERRSYSDPDTKHHRSKRDDKIDDLRSHLLKKEVQKTRDRNDKEEKRDDRVGRDDRGARGDDRGRDERDDRAGNNREV